MEKWRKLIHAKNGFTLVELIVVVVLLMVITVAAVPGFQRSLRSNQFERTVLDIVSLLNQARTQALASKLDSDQKIPSGGYGVFFDFTDAVDPTDQKVVLFVDDWNESAAAAVNVNYADEDIANRVLPDGIFTDGSDTVLATVKVNSPSYVRLKELKGAKLADGSVWASALGNTMTVIFKPPYAETVVIGNNPAATSLQSFDAVFELVTDGLERTIKFNRVTTAPQVIKN